MDDKKFKISGTPENTRIHDDEDDKPEKKFNKDNPFKLRLDHNDIMNILGDLNSNKIQGLEQMRKSFEIQDKDLEKMVESMKEYFLKNINPDILRDIKKSKDKGEDITEEQINELMLDAFGKPNEKGEVNISKMFEAIAEEIEDPDLEDEEETDKAEGRKISAMDVETLLDPDSFKAVLHEPNKNLLEEFKSSFGPGPDYKISLFTELKGFNLTEGLTKVKSISFVEGNEKFLLFRAESGKDGEEGMVVGFIQDRGEFMLIVPSFGNTYDIESGALLDRWNDMDEFEEKKGGTIGLKRPLDMDKIRAGLENVLYEYSKPVLSIQQFGKVMTSKTTVTRSGNALIIGTIISSEQPMAATFKKDFDLPIEQRVFNFYVKFPRSYSKKELAVLEDYIFTLDFNKNPYMQTLELKADSDGEVFVEMDLGELPGNIIKWTEK